MKKIIALVLISVVIFCMAGCDEPSANIIYAEFENAPSNLDPQTAEDFADLMIIRNTYEGLTRKDGEGKTVLACAQSYDVSGGGLAYTFTLKDNLKWNDGTPLTANDFEFAIKRAKAPETKSPFSYMISDIVNCTAKDNKTLTITLSTVDCEILELLSYSICMPCNKEFFEKSKGKYGLSPDYLLSNGSFYIKKWVITGEFAMRMIKNKEYVGDFNSKYDAVFFNLSTQSDRPERINKEYLDFGFCDDYVPSSEYKNVEALTFADSTLYVLVLNDNKILSLPAARKAVTLSVDRDEIIAQLPAKYNISNKYLPLSVVEKNQNICAGLKQITAPGYQPNAASSAILDLLKQKENKGLSFSGDSIIYMKDANTKAMANAVAKSLQKSISAYVNIEEIAKQSDFNAKISNKDYDFAIMEFDSKNGSIFEYLNMFSKLKLPNFDKKLATLSAAKTYDEKAKALTDCINTIKNSNRVLPICSTGHTLLYNKKHKMPKTAYDNGCIDFALVK